MNIGAVLRTARKRKGLSQEELAEKLNRARSCISKFETNQKVIDVPTFIQWAKYTNAQDIMIAALLGLDPLTITQGIEIITKILGG